MRLHRLRRRSIAGAWPAAHYENFSVATWFLPERLRQHFFNVYAYCRISDDLGDEVGDPERLARNCSTSGRRNWMPATTVPAASGVCGSAETVRQFDIPQTAFR